ncbi:MAG: ABC transporter ATP-binding protein [Saprospiraceae bacterium]|nr:ABC transporter ATP-binding protein [Saprospiraceae bacterium]
MIEAKNIFKNYGDIPVLKGVNIQIQTGEIISIVGKSGAGKSTLLHILGTLDNADNGTIIFDDVDINKLNKKQLADFRNQNIGFIFQFHHLLPEFTAIENVCLPGYIKKEKDKLVLDKANELLEYLGLSDRKKHKPDELSGGEQQRVAVARALINNPSIIFADEPSGNLDTQTSIELHQLFFQLRKDFNQTFVIVTHNEELANISDRRLVMADGNILN